MMACTHSDPLLVEDRREVVCVCAFHREGEDPASGSGLLPLLVLCLRLLVLRHAEGEDGDVGEVLRGDPHLEKNQVNSHATLQTTDQI